MQLNGPVIIIFLVHATTLAVYGGGGIWMILFHRPWEDTRPQGPAEQNPRGKTLDYFHARAHDRPAPPAQVWRVTMLCFAGILGLGVLLGIATSAWAFAEVGRLPGYGDPLNLLSNFSCQYLLCTQGGLHFVTVPAVIYLIATRRCDRTIGWTCLLMGIGQILLIGLLHGTSYADWIFD
ncbi:MAG: hypothetical protein AAGK78_07240 [Planctomycetota bacterium]